LCVGTSGEENCGDVVLIHLDKIQMVIMVEAGAVLIDKALMYCEAACRQTFSGEENCGGIV
jgi:hypothetical protein